MRLGKSSAVPINTASSASYTYVAANSLAAGRRQRCADDGMPPAKKARTDVVPSVKEIEPYLMKMSHFDLVVAIEKAWDKSPELRSVLDAATRKDCWGEPPEQTEMLNYNWESDKGTYCKKGAFTILFKNTPPDGKVHIGGTDWTLEMSDIRKELEEGDGEFAFEDEDGDEAGCEECGCPGSTVKANFQVNREGKKRLEVVTQVMCGCHSRYGEPFDAAGGTTTFSIAPHLDAKPLAKGKQAKAKKSK